MALERELATYEAKLEELLAQEGKYVVIHGETVVGTWDTYVEALTAAYEKCGLEPFMVKQIGRGPETINHAEEEKNGSGLEREVATYNAKLGELLAQEGKFVAIHGETVLGFWDTYLEAFDAPRPPGPFLIRQIRGPQETTNGSLRETFKALYKAGGYGWDAVDDPEKFINELRGN